MIVARSWLMFGDPFRIRYLDNFFKLFDNVGKVLHVKRIPKHEPTSSYYHLVGCITEFMLRYDEYNHHVHVGYPEETALSSNVNDTNKD